MEKLKRTDEKGFSLFELIIALAITLALAAAAMTLVAASFKVRSRENRKMDAIADAQRGINLMTREIANAGFGLNNNGIVSSDSTANSIRVRSNLNALSGETTSNSVSDRDEDIKFMLYTDSGSSYIVRLDVNVGAQEMVLANRVDNLNIHYYADKVLYTADNSGGNCDITSVTDSSGTPVSDVTQKSSAGYIVMSACVALPAVGDPGSPGYQPASQIQLVSDVALRNVNLVKY
ncbi:MAG TPA: prepilin-type N-terminal cleavage/methylation domain-containing protein [Pyrinomonadaceae bacterium]|jgi:prepilin-type N-terminal cleavage/methylation domain-containing protein|nr:prepilin-type N-terminal cleavage/methylation domain-containing protein [Pyrinomonadaceae bacterium]